MSRPTGALLRETMRLDDEIADWRSWLSRWPAVLWTAVGILVAAVFLIDLFTPAGSALWALYIVVVLLTAQTAETARTRAVTALCTVLIILGLVLSPKFGQMPGWIAGTNRAVGILAVWITCFLGTQCTRAENRERSGRRLLLTTLKSIGDGVITVDASGRVTFLNAEAERLVGYSIAEAAGSPLPQVFRIVNEQTRRGVENPALRALTEGVVVGLANHTVLIARDGSERPIDDSAAPIRDAAGKVQGVVLVFRDISARKQAERERATLAAIVTSSEDAIVSKDLDGKIMTWNRGAEAMFGYTSDDVIGKPITILFPPDRIDEEIEILSRVRSGQRVEHYETVRLRKDGSTIDISVSVSPVKDEAGCVVGAAKIARDITRRKRAQEALRESRERLRVTLSSIGDAVVATDSAGRITFLNPVAQSLLGFTEEQAAGRLLDEVFRIVNEETRRPVQNPVERVLREGKVVGLANHTVLLSPDGSEVPIDDSAAPILGADGRLAGVVLVFRDITERKQAEQALLEADRRKDHFLAILAHELRNPLAPIRNAVQVLQLNMPREGDLVWCCDVIDRQVAQMARLLDDLLDISRISRGKLELRKQRITLASIVQSAIETSGPYIEERRQVLDVHWPAGALWVDADMTRMAQVFSNLLNNAAKYTETGSRIELRLERRGDQATVTVKDNGIGISPDLLPRIFDMFIQGEHSLEDSQGGLGLGLTLARDIVESHGGSIKAESKGRDRGSEFTVCLPLAPGQAQGETAAPKEAGWRKSETGSGKRVLIVDDNRNQARTLSMLLKTLGHEVAVAYDGAGALETAAEFRPDLALIDIGLPGMSGYELARRIREQPEFRDMILVAQTGWGREEDRRRALEAGFNQHLVKPIDRERFREILAQPKDLNS